MANDIRVSRAAEADIAGCLAIDAIASVESARGLFVTHGVQSGNAWVARAADAIVGFAIMGKFFGHDMLELLCVAEERRRSGIGAALMEAIEAAPATDRVFTSTNESNVPMRAMCLKRGWVFAGQIDYLDPGDPELFFVNMRA